MPQSIRILNIENAIITNIMEGQKIFTCGKCADTFDDEKKYNRHTTKKTGCGVKEIKPEDINNPNRCIYCNSILSCKKTLTSHLKICKEAVRTSRTNAEELRILREEVKIYKGIADTLVEKVKELEKYKGITDILVEKVKELEKYKVNKTINNYGNTYNNNYTIRPYNNPNFDIYINPYDFAKMGPIMRDNFTKLLYFNENAPENHSMMFYNGNLYAKCNDKFKKLDKTEADALYNETGILRDKFGEIITDKISRGKDKHCIPASVKKIIKDYYADKSTVDDRIYSMSNSIKKYSDIALKTIKEESQRINSEQKKEIEAK